MANSIVEKTVSSEIVADLLITAAPELEDWPDVELRALVAQLQPALDLVVSAYRQASALIPTEVAFRRFVQGLAEGGH